MSPGIRVVLAVGRSLRGKSHVEAVRTLLEAMEFEVVTLDFEETGGDPPESFFSECESAPVVVIALREIVPRWVLRSEAELFPTSIVIIIVDKGSQSIAELQKRYRDVAIYDSSNHEQLLQSLLQYLQEAKVELAADPLAYVPLAKRSTETREPYDVLSVHKDVTVSPSGHGYIETTHCIQVLDDGFEGTSHYFGLNEYTPPEIHLPSLLELMEKSVSKRFTDESFSYRLLAPLDRGIYMSAIEVEHESGSRTKVFKFSFSPTVEKGTIIRFAWSWSHPSIFNQRGEDESCLTCSRHYGEVGLGLTFLRNTGETAWPFSDNGSPILRTTNPVGIDLGSVTPKCTVLLHGIRFGWEIFEAEQNSRLAIHWRLR